MAGIIRATLVGLALCIPVPFLWRSKRRLTWASAVVVGTLLTSIALVLIAEVPSRILYYFDSRHGDWAENIPALSFMEGDFYKVVRDIAANTVQMLFFTIILALVYIWGERQRKAGRFR